MKPKMRIQLFDKEGHQIQDRLVDQLTECNMGPKEKSEGMIKIELAIQEKDDIERVISYIKKLTGLVPIEAKGAKTYVKKVKAVNLDDQDSREAFLEELNNHIKDQKDLIKWLREEQGFVLLTVQHMEDIGIKLELPKGTEQQFYIKCLKKAKDPKNDKYDPNLAIGISVIGNPSTYVPIYLFGKLEKELQVPVPKKDFIFKKQEWTKFPVYMTAEEREKWRKEHRELSLNAEKEPSKFYKRWAEHVELPKAVKGKEE